MSELGKKIIAEVRKVAAEKPDFEYRGVCRYVVDAQPGCLVGHALWNLGLIDEDFERHPANDEDVDYVAEYLAYKRNVCDDFDSQELDWLSRAQHTQDDKTPWGECVALADEVTRRGFRS